MKITEKDGVHKGWYEEAKAQTPETLPEFMRKLASDYEHDYGTICHAVAASAVAAAWAMNKSKYGGITGFQAGAIMWEFICHWQYMGEDKPLRLVDYENMLFPQYADKFAKTITPDTWKWLQEEAQKNIDKGAENVHPNVLTHWQSIIDGVVPFGYVVEASK